MYGLEYAMFFGVPSNKIELIEGRSHWVFPFDRRETAEAHFHSWLDTLCRWKQAEPPRVRKSSRKWQADVGGIGVELYPRPIRLEFPIPHFRTLRQTFNRRDFWPGQPEGLEHGWESPFDEGDVRMNLWKLLDGLSERHGGQYSSRCDIAISDTAAVAPDAYYYRDGRTNIMLEDYFGAAPDLIAEVLSAASRALDRSVRMEIYRRCGVEHLWLVDPACETVDAYRLAGDYELKGRYVAGETFENDLFPGEKFAVDDLFKTQSKRRPGERRSKETAPEPIPEWLLPPDFKVGLEYFFHLGHPEHRWEIWNNKACSVLAFGSPNEARARLDHFVAEAGRWEGQPNPKAAPLADDVDRAEIGRFQLTRRGRLIWLDVAVDGRRYKELLGTWCQREAWDWGKGEE